MPAVTIWGRVAGAAAARRALPVWAGTGVVAAIVFGGTGLQPHDLTQIARHEPRVGAVLALLWIVMIAPVGAAIADPPGAAWLRALPIARAVRRGVAASAAITAQAPWALLWWRGEGAWWGTSAALSSAAITIVAGRARWPFAARRPRWRGALGALVGVHARALLRTRAPAIARAIAWAACGGLAAGLVARANDVALHVPLLVAVAIAAPLGLAGLAAPVADSDRAIGWAALAASRGTRAAAQAIALGAGGATIGLASAIAALALGAGGPLDAAAAIGLGAGLGACAARAGAWAARSEVTDGTRAVIGMTGAAVATVLAVAVLGAWAIAGVAVAAVGLVAPLAAPRGAS